MKKKYMWTCVVILALMPFQVYAGGPMETAETEVKKILAVLGDKTLTGEAGTTVKKEKLRAIFDDIFDYVQVLNEFLIPIFLHKLVTLPQLHLNNLSHVFIVFNKIKMC